MEKVAALMRYAAAAAILPRFQRLQTHDIEEKSPGDRVTAADREAELILSEGLLDLLPGSKVLGEEACSTRPTLIEELKNEARLWVVDPVDGTANYVAGIPCFAVMVARLDFGETVASWILDPVTDSLVTASGAPAPFSMVTASAPIRRLAPSVRCGGR